MALIDYKLDENVAIVTLKDNENCFNPNFLNAYLSILDEIEKKTEALTLIVTSDHEKIFSNGIDLQWLLPVIQNNDSDQAKSFFYLLNTFFKRTLTYPLITIACMNGHIFAGGAIWSCAFDFRYMRSDRGYFCFPEVDLGIPFLPGMLALLNKAIPYQKMQEMIVTGERLTAEQCLESSIIHKACHVDKLFEETLSFAKGLNKKRAFIKEMRHRLYNEIIHAIEVSDTSYIESGKFNIG